MAFTYFLAYDGVAQFFHLFLVMTVSKIPRYRKAGRFFLIDRITGLIITGLFLFWDFADAIERHLLYYFLLRIVLKKLYLCSGPCFFSKKKIPPLNVGYMVE